ncbi:MAG: hypothetical protein K8T90_14325 [Planctomycetes bacterium]|nr:hypothetical protein [Planctomycetota bacterium]
MKISHLVVAAASLLLAACAAKTGGTDIDAFDPPRPTRIIVPNERQRAWIAASPTVFVGRITALGKPPGIWCGVLATYQTVDFDVERVVRGAPVGKRVRVWFAIAEKDGGVDDIPRLDPGVFRLGATGVMACGPRSSPDETARGGPVERLSASSAFHEIPAGKTAEDVLAGR